MKKYLISILITTISMCVYAQEEVSIRLLDLESALPISGATFQYASQQGLSNEKGIISFTPEEEETMQLSHVNYGGWQLSADEIKESVAAKVYYREQITVNLYPVEVISVRSTQSSEEVLNLDYQDKMAHDAGALLSRTAGFNAIRKSGNYGFDPVFRGFKYDQLNIVLNGAQGATAACPNRMDPPTSQMAPNMMSRIEVLKGPYALRYGAGVGATINFVPNMLRFTKQPSVYGRVSSGYESNGGVFRSEAQVGVSGDIFDISTFGSWSGGGDYEAGNGDEVQADFRRSSFGINLGVKLAANHQIRASAVYNRARDADFPALGMDLRDDDTWLFNLRHDATIDGTHLQSWNTTLFGSFVDHKMNNLLRNRESRMADAETNATTFNYGGRTEGVWRFDNHTLYAGADIKVEGAEGVRVRDFYAGMMAGRTFEDNAWQDGQISKTGLFAEYQWQVAGYQLITSARMEVNQSEINDPDEGFTDINSETSKIQYNPSVSLGVSRALSEPLTFGLWIGRVQRSGSLTERFINYFPVGRDPFEMLGNPSLDPEVNNQVDLNVNWSVTNTSINVTVFTAYLQDYISSVIRPDLDPIVGMNPGVRQFINISETFKTGFEVGWTQMLWAGLSQEVAVAYTYGQDLERNEPLPEIAPFDFNYTLRGNYFENSLQVAATWRYVAEQSRESIEFGETETPSFNLLDVNVSYQVNKYIRVGAGVNNLLDENYYEHLNRSVQGVAGPIFAPGRNWFGSVNVSF